MEKLEGLLRGSSGGLKLDTDLTQLPDPPSPLADLNAVAAFWQEFQLETFRQRMDEQGMAVAGHQEASLKSRRKLAETTKDFKKSASAELNKDIGTLLKAYQEEVDRLTTRAKFGESAFLEAYQKLYEAPDPAVVLMHSAGNTARIAELEESNRKVQQELTDFKAESKDLRNQDLTIKRLEAQVGQMKSQLQSKDEQLEQAVNSAAAATDAKLVEEMQQREESLSAALLEARASLSNMQRLHQASQNQLFTMQSQTEEQQAGLRSELDIATDEMERAQRQLAALEKQREVLQQDAAASSPQAVSRAVPNRAVEDSLRRELQGQRDIVASLHEELSRTIERMQQDEETRQSQCSRLEDQLAAAQAEVSKSQQELKTRPTMQQVAELQQHIKVLQAVGLNAMEGEEEEDFPSGNNGHSTDSAAQHSLEKLLLAKNRHLEHELTMSRLKVADLTGQSESAEAQAAELEGQLRELQGLNAKLEEDLLAAERSNSMYRISNGRNPDADDLAARAQPGNGEEEGEQTMVKVLCSQRDRFKEKARQLEQQLAQAQSEAQAARGRSEALRADNLALLERLKFVQGYQAQTRPRKNADPEAGDVEGRYNKAYEEKMNPFSDFRTREREARRQQMNIMDRIMFEFGQFISGSKYARMFVFCYTLALHLLIMGVLARYSHRHTDTLAATELLCAQQAHQGIAITSASTSSGQIATGTLE